MRESRAQTPVMWNKKVSAGFRAENGVPRLYSGARFKVPRPSDTAMACLSGYSDSRNWPSGLQPVATESATAKQPGRVGESRAPADGTRKRGEKKNSDKRVKARVETGLLGQGQRTGEDKKRA